MGQNQTQTTTQPDQIQASEAEPKIRQRNHGQQGSIPRWWLALGIALVVIVVAALWLLAVPAIIWLSALATALFGLLILQQWRWYRLVTRETLDRTHMREIRQAYHRALTQELATAEELRKSQSRMEQEVTERTRELAESNRKLSTEMRLKDAYTEALQQNDQKLQMAMQASRLAVWDWDIQQRQLHVSGPENAFGQRRNGRMLPLQDYIRQEDFPAVRQVLIEHLRGRSQRLSVRYRDRSEPARWFADTGRVISYDRRNRPARMLGTRRDITQEVEREQELILAGSLFNDNRDPILVLDEQFRVSAMNPAFADLIRVSAKQWQGRLWHDCTSSDLADEVTTRLLEQGRWEGELLEHRSDGHAFPMWVSFRAVMANNKISHYLGFCRNLSHGRPSRVALSRGQHDVLTGLPNRAHFHQQVDYYRRLDKLPHQQVAVALLNVDGFQAINEHHGHSVGDLLLQDLAARLNQYGAPLMLVSRLGADEFGLLFSHFETPLKLQHLADQIVADIHRPMLLDDHEVLPSASMGLVVLTTENRHECLNEASDALDAARRRGGNQLAHNGALNLSPDAQRRRSLKVLQHILDSLDSPLRFRPQASPRGIINGIRVSSVLEHDELGDIRSEPLYALAQERQLEERLYQQLLSEACECFVQCAANYPQAVLQLSFPLNSRLVFNEQLRGLTEDVLQPYALAPEQLELCISAGVLHHDRTLVSAQLNALARAGFKLALEDAEAWPLTLSQLGQLPFSKIRIVQPMDATRTTDHSALPLMLALAEQLGWDSCITRVNAPEQARRLSKLRIQQLEGEQIAHSLGPAELLNFISHYQPLLAPSDQLH